uniref:Uncharacterized protein n=1 Tax=Arundo donax TaxID=35708 RepID=A0A0A9A2T5_ARUDO
MVTGFMQLTEMYSQH